MDGQHREGAADEEQPAPDLVGFARRLVGRRAASRRRGRQVRATPDAAAPRAVEVADRPIPARDVRDFVADEPFATATVQTTLTPATMQGAPCRALPRPRQRYAASG